jgi:hypothetical protein
VIAVLDKVLALHKRVFAPAPQTRDDARHAAVAVLARKFKPWRIAFAMHRVGGRS